MKPWILTPQKYLKEEEVKRLRTLLEEKAIVALSKRQKKAIRDWMLIDLALSTGLRVGEISSLKLKDIYLDKEGSQLCVRKAKANKSRLVAIGDKLRKHLKQFIAWKKQGGESVKPEACLFVSERSDQMSTSAIQRRFKRWSKIAGLDSHYSIHSTRHTYGTMLYRATRDLRLVQKQLGHSSSAITEVYADILPEDAQSAVNLLYA